MRFAFGKIKKQCKCISLLLILSMLFAGMCLESVQADSFLSYTGNTRPISELQHSEPENALYDQLFTQETLGESTPAQIRQDIRRITTRSSRNASLDFSFMEPAFTATSLPEHTCINLADTDIHSNRIILRYLHRKDGKKSHF